MDTEMNDKAETVPACCCHTGGTGKTKMRTEEDKKALITRLNRIDGQIRGISKMIENNAYCVDVLTQVAAAQSALNGFSRVVLDTHIRTCVADGVRKGDDAVLDELLDIMRKFMK